MPVRATSRTQMGLQVGDYMGDARVIRVFADGRYGWDDDLQSHDFEVVHHTADGDAELNKVNVTNGHTIDLPTTVTAEAGFTIANGSESTYYYANSDATAWVAVSPAVDINTEVTHAATIALDPGLKDAKGYAKKDACIGWSYDRFNRVGENGSKWFQLAEKTWMITQDRSSGQGANVWFGVAQAASMPFTGVFVAVDAGFLQGINAGGHNVQTGAGQYAYARRDGNTGNLQGYLPYANAGMLWAIVQEMSDF